MEVQIKTKWNCTKKIKLKHYRLPIAIEANVDGQEGRWRWVYNWERPQCIEALIVKVENLVRSKYLGDEEITLPFEAQCHVQQVGMIIR